VSTFNERRNFLTGMWIDTSLYVYCYCFKLKPNVLLLVKI